MGRPKIETPKPTPPPRMEVSPETEEQAMKRVRKRSGFETTFLTGIINRGNTRKKTVLG